MPIFSQNFMFFFENPSFNAQNHHFCPKNVDFSSKNHVFCVKILHFSEKKYQQCTALTLGCSPKNGVSVLIDIDLGSPVHGWSLTNLANLFSDNTKTRKSIKKTHFLQIFWDNTHKMSKNGRKYRK